MGNHKGDAIDLALKGKFPHDKRATNISTSSGRKPMILLIIAGRVIIKKILRRKGNIQNSECVCVCVCTHMCKNEREREGKGDEG